MLAEDSIVYTLVRTSPYTYDDMLIGVFDSRESVLLDSNVSWTDLRMTRLSKLKHTISETSKLEQASGQMMTTKDINVADILTFEDRDAIAKIIDKRVTEEYGDMFNFKWSVKHLRTLYL